MSLNGLRNIEAEKKIGLKVRTFSTVCSSSVAFFSCPLLNCLLAFCAEEVLVKISFYLRLTCRFTSKLFEAYSMGGKKEGHHRKGSSKQLMKKNKSIYSELAEYYFHKAKISLILWISWFITAVCLHMCPVCFELTIVFSGALWGELLSKDHHCPRINHLKVKKKKYRRTQNPVSLWD